MFIITSALVSHGFGHSSVMGRCACQLDLNLGKEKAWKSGLKHQNIDIKSLVDVLS